METLGQVALILFISIAAAAIFYLLRWPILSLFFRTAGKTSEAIKLGYAQGFDSGQMMDYIYENRPRGRYLVGPLIDRIYLEAIGPRGLRGRRAALTALLVAEIEANRKKGIPTRILDVAGGPGRYLLDALKQAESGDVSAVCRDLDEEGLRRGRELAKAMGVASIQYEAGNALDPQSLATVSPRPNLVVASGFYEILLDDELIKKSMCLIYDLLEPGGAIIFTTQVRHPQLEIIANVLVTREGKPWIMKLRSNETTEGWAREVGFTDLRTTMEREGLYALTVGRKGG